jgi:hypothetical protein
MLDTPETARPETLASELKEFRSEILDNWMAAKLATSELATTEVSIEVDRERTSDLLDDFVALVDHGDLGNETTSPFRALKDSLELEQIAFAQAAAGMSIGDIGRSIVSLKDALHNHQERIAPRSRLTWVLVDEAMRTASIPSASQISPGASATFPPRASTTRSDAERSTS